MIVTATKGWEPNENPTPHMSTNVLVTSYRGVWAAMSRTSAKYSPTRLGLWHVTSFASWQSWQVPGKFHGKGRSGDLASTEGICVRTIWGWGLSEFGTLILQESPGAGWWPLLARRPCATMCDVWRRLTLAPSGMEWHTPNGLMLYDGYWAENYADATHVLLFVRSAPMWCHGFKYYRSLKAKSSMSTSECYGSTHYEQWRVSLVLTCQHES